MRFIVTLFLFVAVALLVFLGFQGLRRTPPPPPAPSPAAGNRVRVGVSGRPSSLPVFALGRLLPTLQVEVQPFKDPGEMWQLLAAGQLDLVLTTLDQFALAVPRHDPGVLLFPSVRSVGSDAVVARPDVRRPEDLDGHRIAFVPGTGGEYLVVNYLSAQPSVAYEVVAARDVEQAVEWLRRGDVAAAAVWEPWVEDLREGGFNVLWSSREILLTDVWVASRQSLRGEGAGPQGLEAVAQAWFSLIDRLRSTPGLALKAISEETGQDQGALERSLEGLEFLNLEEARAFDQQRLVDALQTLRHDWSLYGAFRGPANPRNVDLGTATDMGLVQGLTLPRDASGPPEPVFEQPATPGPDGPPETETPTFGPGAEGPGASPGTPEIEVPAIEEPPNPEGTPEGATPMPQGSPG